MLLRDAALEFETIAGARARKAKTPINSIATPQNRAMPTWVSRHP
jgi:hypothetical protein